MIHRHFGTKEALVLCDEHDAVLDDALAERILGPRRSDARSDPPTPLEMLRDAFVEVLAPRYQADLAIERWRERRGREDLAALIHQAFGTLEQLGSLR